MEENDIYIEELLQDMVEDDELAAWEQAFMVGYLE